MGGVKKTIYKFSLVDGHRESAVADKGVVGGKGAALLVLSQLGIEVPPGFTVSTEVCNNYYETGELPSGFDAEVDEALDSLAVAAGLRLGDVAAPLLVSVRSGAPVSMPGMMDTVLNIGLNDEVVEAVAVRYNSARFAYDSYRRLIQMFGSTVLGIESDIFERELDNLRAAEGVASDSQLSVDGLKGLVERYKKIFHDHTGENFPQDVRKQVQQAMVAVIRSWQSERAIKYREIHNIPSNLGTAITVQSMVFGNRSERSCTGVIFSRDPSTGKNQLFGEFLVNAQGEDIVAGIRDSLPITVAMKASYRGATERPSMEEIMPAAFVRLSKICCDLEKFYGDMQDIEFTVEEDKLWILQSRAGKRSSAAALRIAHDMVAEGLIREQQALQVIPPPALEQLLHPSFDYSEVVQTPLVRGLAASPGAAVGAIAITAAQAENMGRHGRVILVRNETSPDDMAGIAVAEGIVTARGGMTSHAAVVARGMGKPCVCSTPELQINYEAQTVSLGGQQFAVGDYLSIDGGKGDIYAGQLPMSQSLLPEEFSEISQWIDKYKRLDVYANAENMHDITTAVALGAAGIGLCRTEHMFFAPERIMHMRKMILSESRSDRLANLDCLLEYQKQDFRDIFIASRGRSVTIRLLDPPLHEFLPHTEREIDDFCAASGMSPNAVRHALSSRAEHNPMLGHRGCRLAITYPEIYEMQVRAIFLVLFELLAEGVVAPNEVHPEIMIPLVSSAAELVFCRRIVDNTYRKVRESLEIGTKAAAGMANSVGGAATVLPDINYRFGSMIELPSAALQADSIAKVSDFISFGTNDLTQTTLGLSRDDSERFIPAFINKGIWINDPFVTIETNSVGQLLEIATQKARNANPGIKIGVCGEHGGDPQSIAFINRLGVDYVSCSPYRVPLARLAAAQATIGLAEQSGNK